MDMRGQMGITGQQKNQLRGDASVMKSEKKESTNGSAKPKSSKDTKATASAPKKIVAKTNVQAKIQEANVPTDDAWGDEDKAQTGALGSMSTVRDSLPKPEASAPPKSSYVPPHLRNKAAGSGSAAPASRYVPPHLRNR